MGNINYPLDNYTLRNSIAIPKYHFEDESQRRAKLFIRKLGGASGEAPSNSSLESLQQVRTDKQSAASKMKRILDVLTTSGYIDFLLMQAEMPMQEKMNLLRLAGDQYVVHFTGMEPPIWQYGGVLVNAANANHLQHFIIAYNYFLRASRVAGANAEISLHYDDFRVRGQMTGMTGGIRGEQQLAGSFSFQVLVRQIRLKPMLERVTESGVGSTSTAGGAAIYPDSGSTAITSGEDLGDVGNVG